MKKTSCLILFYVCFLSLSGTTAAYEKNEYVRLREDMVRQQIMARGVEDPQVLEAVRKVPRHVFVPENYRAHSYGDYPLPIGQGQTISQPYVVAFMTEALDLKDSDKVLEIGTGSGYQAAILAEIVEEVYTIEIIEELGRRALKTLNSLGYGNVHVKIGDGYKGWPEKAPFDAVIVTCAPERIPKALIEQLAEGGRMILPVGKAGSIQRLIRAVKKNGKLMTKKVMPVRFVPMVKGPD